jgi:hypothetical protein
VSSSEKSIKELAGSAKQERQYGEAIRLIDVPVLFDGLHHIFDQIPVDQRIADLRNWKSETFKKIANACQENHGMAFREYVKELSKDRKKLREDVDKKISVFVKHVTNQFDGDLAKDVAEKFGLIYAGARLGIRYGLLPWDKRQTLAAIAKAYTASRGLLPDHGVLLRQGMHALKSKLHSLPRISKRSAGKTDCNQVDGYRRRKRKWNLYRIKRDAFNSLFHSDEQRDAVIAWLTQQKRITPSTPKRADDERRPQKQFTWPDGVRRRTIEISWRRRRKKKCKSNKSSRESR